MDIAEVPYRCRNCPEIAEYARAVTRAQETLAFIALFMCSDDESSDAIRDWYDETQMELAESQDALRISCDRTLNCPGTGNTNVQYICNSRISPAEQPDEFF